MSLRVLMFGWEFPPYNSGGLGVACLGLTRALSERDVEVTFVLPKLLDLHSDFIRFVFADTSISKFSNEEIASLFHGYSTSESYTVLRNKLTAGMYGSTLFAEVNKYALLGKKIAEEREFDVIHAHDWLTFQAGVFAKIASGKPLVLHVHATEFDRSGGNNVNQQVYKIEKHSMDVCDRIVAVSEFTKNMIVEHYDIDPDKIEIVHNGINAQEYAKSETVNNTIQQLKASGKKIVLFVGRFTMQKGPDYFLKAAQKVLEYDPNIIFVMAGSGDMEYQLLNQVGELSISDKVLFPGFLRGEELNQIYNMSDLFVMPSVSEPFGLVLLEAMVSGIPVITSKQSGVSEVVKNALKVDFWDVDEMTNMILSVVSNSSLQSTLAANGQVEAGAVSWDKAARKISKVYIDLVGRHKLTKSVSGG